MTDPYSGWGPKPTKQEQPKPEPRGRKTKVAAEEASE